MIASNLVKSFMHIPFQNFLLYLKKVFGSKVLTATLTRAPQRHDEQNPRANSSSKSTYECWLVYRLYELRN